MHTPHVVVIECVLREQRVANLPGPCTGVVATVAQHRQITVRHDPVVGCDDHTTLWIDDARVFAWRVPAVPLPAAVAPGCGGAAIKPHAAWDTSGDRPRDATVAIGDDTILAGCAGQIRHHHRAIQRRRLVHRRELKVESFRRVRDPHNRVQVPLRVRLVNRSPDRLAYGQFFRRLTIDQDGLGVNVEPTRPRWCHVTRRVTLAINGEDDAVGPVRRGVGEPPRDGAVRTSNHRWHARQRHTGDRQVPSQVWPCE